MVVGCDRTGETWFYIKLIIGEAEMKSPFISSWSAEVAAAVGSEPDKFEDGSYSYLIDLIKGCMVVL